MTGKRELIQPNFTIPSRVERDQRTLPPEEIEYLPFRQSSAEARKRRGTGLLSRLRSRFTKKR